MVQGFPLCQVPLHFLSVPEPLEDQELHWVLLVLDYLKPLKDHWHLPVLEVPEHQGSLLVLCHLQYLVLQPDLAVLLRLKVLEDQCLL